MGAQLVGRAIAFAAMNDLKPNEYRLLIFMAHTALDTDQPPRYFASREESAYGLGRMVADSPGGAVEQAARTSAFQLVKVATQGLVTCGAIERLERGRAGRRAEYALTFGKRGLPLEGKRGLPQFGKAGLLPAGSISYPQGTTEEPQEERPRRTPRLTEASHLQPVDNSDERKSA